MAGITGLVGKILLVQRECPVFGTQTGSKNNSTAFSGFEYYKDATEGPVGKTLGYLKGGQTIHVLEDFGVVRDVNIDDKTIQRTFYLASCRVLTPASPMGDNGTQGEQYTYIKNQVVTVWIGSQGSTGLSLNPNGGSFFKESSITDTSAVVDVPATLSDASQDAPDLVQEEGIPTSANKNIVFIGDGQIASGQKKVDRLRAAVKSYFSSSNPSSSGTSPYDTVYHRAKKSKSIYALKDNAKLSVRRRGGLKKRINSLKDPTEIIVLSLGTEDMKDFDTRREDFKIAAKSILATVADSYIESRRAGSSLFQTLKSCKGIILIGVMPPREDSKLSFPPENLIQKLSNNVKDANVILKQALKEVVAEKDGITTSDMWFINPSEIANVGWTPTPTSVSSKSSSSEKHGRYFYLTNQNAGKFVGIAGAYGLLYVNSNLSPLQDNLTPTNFSDWTQRVQSGETEPYYVNEVAGTKVCEWYIPVKTVYDHTADYRRYLPGEKTPGQIITLGGQPQVSPIEEKIDEYRKFAFEKIIRFVLGGKEEYDSWKTSPSGTKVLGSASQNINKNTFICQPYEYRQENIGGQPGPLVDADKVDVSSANVIRLPKSIYNDPRTGGKLWLLYKITDKQFKEKFEIHTRAATTVKSAKDVNYTTRILLGVNKLLYQAPRIKENFEKLDNIINKNNHIVYANSQPSAQFSYKKDGEDLYNFYQKDLLKLLKNNNLDPAAPLFSGVVEIGLGPDDRVAFCYFHKATAETVRKSLNEEKSEIDIYNTIEHAANFETYNLIKGFEQFKNCKLFLSGRLRGYLQTNVLNTNNTANLSLLIKDLKTAIADSESEAPKQKWIEWVKKYTFPTLPQDPVVKPKPADKVKSSSRPGGRSDTKKKVLPRKTLEQRLNAARKTLETDSEAYDIMFGKETKKEVGRVVNSPSFFTLVENVDRVFGDDGLYDVILNKTDWRVLVKTVAECMAIELEGDDLIEVLCNVVLQFTPIDELKEVVNQAVKDGVADFKEVTSQAIEEISTSIESGTGYSPQFFSTVGQEMLKSIDFSQELNFEMFKTQAIIDPNGSSAEWSNMFSSDPGKDSSSQSDEACSSAYDNSGASYKPVSSKYSSSKKGAPDEKFLFSESSKGYSNAVAVRVWQKLLWVISQPSKKGGLNLGMLIPRGTVHDRWIDGKFGKDTAHATKIFLGRSHVTYKDFDELFSINTLKPYAKGNTVATDHKRQMEALYTKLNSDSPLSSVPSLYALRPMRDPSSQPSNGDYIIEVQRISYDAFSLSQEFLVTVFEYQTAGNIGSKKLINRKITNSNAEAKEVVRNFAKSLKRQKPSTTVIIDNRDLKKFDMPQQMQNAADFRNFAVKTLGYMDPATATDAIFSLADAGGLEVNKLMNKFFDRRQLCDLFSDAIQQMMAFMQGTEGNWSAILEELGSMFDGTPENITAFFEDLGEGISDFFESLAQAWINAAITSLEVVIVELVKIAMQFLLVACKYVQRAIQLEIRDSLAEPLRSTEGYKRLHGDQNEKGVSSEEGLMNMAEDMQLTNDGFKLLPQFPENGEGAINSLVSTLLNDYGKSIDDIDSVVNVIIPATMDMMVELETRLTPTEMMSIVTAGSYVTGETNKIIKDVIDDQPNSSALKDFYKGEYGFVEFVEYAGSFLKIPTIKQLEDIRTLDPCELIENPFLLEDLKLQQEKQKHDVKNNLQELLSTVISPELPADPNLNIGLPSNFYGIRDTMLDGIFDTITTVFNMEAASIPSIYTTNSDPKALLQAMDPDGGLGVVKEMENGIFDPQVSFTDEGNLDYFKTLAGYSQAFGRLQNDVTLFRDLRSSMMLDSNYFWQVTPVAGSYQRALKLDDGKVGASLTSKDINSLVDKAAKLQLSTNITQKLDDEIEIFSKNNPEYELVGLENIGASEHLGSFSQGYQVYHYEFTQQYGKTEFYAIEKLDTNVRMALNINSDPTVEFGKDSVFPLNLSQEGYRPEYGDTSAWAFGIMIKNSVYKALTSNNRDGYEVYQTFFDEANDGPQNQTSSTKLIHDIKTNHFSPLSLSYFRKIGSLISESPLLKTIEPPTFNQHEALADIWKNTLSEEMLAYTENFDPASPQSHAEYQEKPVMANMFFATSLIKNVLNKCGDTEPPDILKIDSIKDLVGERHKSYSDNADFSKLPAKDNDLLQLASLEGILRLKFRVFILDYIFKSIFVYTEFRADNILNNESFLEFILNKVEAEYGSSYFQSLLGLAYVIYEKRLESGEVFDETIASGMHVLRKMISEELNEVAEYVSSIIPTMAYKIYQEYEDLGLTGCPKNIVDMFWRVEEEEDIPDVFSSEYIDKYFICPKVFEAPVFTELDLSNQTSDQAAIRDLAGDENAHVFEFDDILHNRIVNNRFAEKEILKYFTKPFEGGSGFSSSDQHGGFFLEKFILVIDKKEIDPDNPDEGPQSILDKKIISLGEEYEGFQRSIDTIGVCNIKTFYSFLNGLRKDAINAPELGDPTLKQFEVPPDMIDFRYPGIEANILKIEEILDEPLDYFFEEFSFGLRLMYMPKPVDMVDLKSIEFATGTAQIDSVDQVPHSIPEIQKELSSYVNISSLDLQAINDKLTKLIEDDNFSLETMDALFKNLAVATPADNKIGKLIRDMLLENILIGSLTEQELKDKIAARVFEIDQMLLANPQDEYIVEFLGESIAFSSFEASDPTPLMNSAFDRIKDFFIRNKAYLLNESYTASDGTPRILQTTPIPVAQTTTSIFDLLPGKTLLDLAGEAEQPDAFIDVTFEKVYPSNQWISELRGAMFTHGRALHKTVSRYRPQHEKIAEIYRSIFGVLGDPGNKGSLVGPQKEATPDYPHGAFPLSYYMDDNEIQHEIQSAKSVYSGGNPAEVGSLPSTMFIDQFNKNRESMGFSGLYNPDEDSMTGFGYGEWDSAADHPFNGNSYGPFDTSYTGEAYFANQGHSYSTIMYLPDGTRITQQQLVSATDPGTGFPTDYVTFFTWGDGSMVESYIDPGEDNIVGTEDDWAWNNIADCGKEDLFGATKCRYASRWDQLGAKRIVTMINPVYTAVHGDRFGTYGDFLQDNMAPLRPQSTSLAAWNAKTQNVMNLANIDTQSTVAFVAGQYDPSGEWADTANEDYTEGDNNQINPFTSSGFAWNIHQRLEKNLSFVRHNSLNSFFATLNYEHSALLKVVNWRSVRVPAPTQHIIYEIGATGIETGTTLGHGQWGYPEGETSAYNNSVGSSLLNSQMASIVKYSEDIDSSLYATLYSHFSRGIVAVEYEMEVYADGPLKGKTVTCYAMVYDQEGGHITHENSSMYNIYWAYPGYYPRHRQEEYLPSNTWSSTGKEPPSPYEFSKSNYTVEGTLVRFPPQVDFRGLVDTAVDTLFDNAVSFYDWDLNKYSDENDNVLEKIEDFDDDSVASYERDGTKVYYFNPPGHEFTVIGEDVERPLKEQLGDITFTVKDYVADMYDILINGPTPITGAKDAFIPDVSGMGFKYCRRLLIRIASTIENIDRRLLPHVDIFEYTADSFSGNLYDALLWTAQGGGRLAAWMLLSDVATGIGYVMNGIRDMRDAHLGLLDISSNPLDPLEELRMRSFYGQGDQSSVVNYGQQGNLGPFQLLDHNSPEFFLGGFYDKEEAFSRTRVAKQKKVRYKTNNPFIEVQNELATYTLSNAENEEGVSIPLIDAVEKMHLTPPHAAQANEDMILGIDFGDLKEDDFESQVNSILNAAGINSVSYEGAKIKAEAKKADSNPYEYYYNVLLYGWDGFGPWGQGRFGEFNPNTLALMLSPMDFEKISNIYDWDALIQDGSEFNVSVSQSIDFLRFSPLLDPALKTTINIDEGQLLSSKLVTGANPNNLPIDYDPDWITTYYLGSNAGAGAAHIEKYLLTNDSSDELSEIDTLPSVADGATIIETLFPSGVEYYELPKSVFEDTGIGDYDVFILDPADVLKHKRAVNKLLIWMSNPTLSNFNKWIEQSTKISYAIRMPVAAFLRASLIKNEGEQGPDGWSMGSGINSYNQTAVKNIKYKSPTGPKGQFKMEYLQEGNLVDDDGSTSIVVKGLQTILFGAFASVTKSSGQFIYSKSEDDDIKNILGFARLVAVYVEAMRGSSSAMAPNSPWHAGLPVVANGAEITITQEKVFENMGKDLLSSQFSGVYDSMLSDLKSSEEITMLLKYIFPVEKMLYLLTNYIYQQVTTSRPGMNKMLDGTKGSIKNLMLTLSNSSQTFFKDKNTLEQLNKEIADSGQGNYDDIDQEMKHFADMAVPMILRGVLQEIDPAWKITKIAAEASGGKFKANEKCGYPFEPFNGKYSGNQWPLMFISTPVGLAASGIWTAVQPLPCRINEVPDMTCEDLTIEPCEEEE